jgi:hypothetical protein
MAEQMPVDIIPFPIPPKIPILKSALIENLPISIILFTLTGFFRLQPITLILNFTVIVKFDAFSLILTKKFYCKGDTLSLTQ